MGNRLMVSYRRFTALNDDGTEEFTGYGYLIWDSYDTVYVDTFDDFDSLRAAVNPQTILQVIADQHEDPSSGREFLQSALLGEGLEFNGVWYDIKDLPEPDI